MGTTSQPPVTIGQPVGGGGGYSVQQGTALPPGQQGMGGGQLQQPTIIVMQAPPGTYYQDPYGGGPRYSQQQYGGSPYGGSGIGGGLYGPGTTSAMATPGGGMVLISTRDPRAINEYGWVEEPDFCCVYYNEKDPRSCVSGRRTTLVFCG